MDVIHYGSANYNPTLFNPISDVPFATKPAGGLWTSPVNSQWGWKEWVTSNDFGALDDHFILQVEGNILTIDSYADMMELPWINSHGIWFITFQALCHPDFYYDAIHLTVKGERETRYSTPQALYGWDCETVLILNPACIKT